MTPTAPALSGISLTVNGTRREIPAESTLSGLLESLDLDPRMVVVERNRTILRDRDSYGSISLEAGDVLEIVQFVGGG
ncbi:MAG: sulfur carrier protein ThiS [Gemmatimonadaceae bacterium]|nr:sulfur carrier protein ThiS [Gemmatimonadaceae bacterium]